ncbi:DUF1054 domain-containing protein [Fodinisporobacter ferrooxydans]|uniref:UPF0637 protein LSG31_00865 n=1 Tax=Fodinisporobacter ferrooxydans TaxID=2901836 RepID=A0ABY4CKR3_9BACL|nr:DUF1054 domain-containing protein [Alicyclobacillaceae bacterium MYW30-H2]
MSFSGFTAQEFEVFGIPGLEERMDALRTFVQPKFKEIGQALVGDISALIGEEFYVHIAKHARRKVNPPNDSWLSFATSPRGYKMLPHFQIGLWSTHAFIQFAIIYECARKEEFGEKLLEHWASIRGQIPDDYIWYDDHIKPHPYPHGDVGTQIGKLAERLIKHKNSELLCGIQIPRQEAVKMTGQEFYEKAYETIKTLVPLYKLL